MLSGGSSHYYSTSTATAKVDGVVWDAGLSYSTGPYAISLGAINGEFEGLVANTNDDETTTIMLSGKYTLGPGVDWKTSLFTTDYDDETNAAANNNDGWGLVTGLHLTF